MDKRYIFKYESGEHFSIDAETIIEAAYKADRIASDSNGLLRDYPKLCAIYAGQERRSMTTTVDLAVERRSNAYK